MRASLRRMMNRRGIVFCELEFTWCLQKIVETLLLFFFFLFCLFDFLNSLQDCDIFYGLRNIQGMLAK